MTTPTALTTSQQGLVEQHVDYGRALARAISKGLPRNVDFEELAGFAMLGLSQAVRDFDPTAGAAFTTFAYYRIRGAVFDGVRKMTWLSPRQRARVARDDAGNDASRYAEVADGRSTKQDAESLATQVDAAITRAAGVYLLGSVAESDRPIEPVDDQTPDMAGEQRELVDKLRAAIATLPADEAELIRAVYFEDKSITDVAADRGVHKSSISRQHARILASLQSRFR